MPVIEPGVDNNAAQTSIRTLPESLKLINSPLQNGHHRANHNLIEFATGPMFLSRR